MARPKKDGEKISLYLNKSTMDKVRYHANEKGQTITMAMERLLEKALDEEGIGDVELSELCGGHEMTKTDMEAKETK